MISTMITASYKADSCQIRVLDHVVSLPRMNKWAEFQRNLFGPTGAENPEIYQQQSGNLRYGKLYQSHGEEKLDVSEGHLTLYIVHDRELNNAFDVNELAKSEWRRSQFQRQGKTVNDGDFIHQTDEGQQWAVKSFSKQRYLVVDGHYHGLVQHRQYLLPISKQHYLAFSFALQGSLTSELEAERLKQFELLMADVELFDGDSLQYSEPLLMGELSADTLQLASGKTKAKSKQARLFFAESEKQKFIYQLCSTSGLVASVVVGYFFDALIQPLFIVGALLITLSSLIDIGFKLKVLEFEQITQRIDYEFKTRLKLISTVIYKLAFWLFFWPILMFVIGFIWQ